MIMKHLDILLSSSDPGDVLHHLHVIAAPRDAVGPFGMPDETQLKSTVYAIAADIAVESVESFIAKVIMTAAIECTRKNAVPLFAALNQEVFALVGEASDDELARRLHKEGRLSDHPDAAEATLVYATCRDGRRWRGRRWLTGPKAGQTEDVELLVGRPDPREAKGLPAALMLKLVGLR